MRTIPASLPEPNRAERERSEQVAALIEREIAAAGGCIGFDRFMELALYAPGLGYYAGGAVRFGEHGDFVTAPELGSLFGRCLARQLAEVLAELDGGSVLEFGAGSGALCVQVLECLAEFGEPPHRYLILETSADLRIRQQQAVSRLPLPLASRVEWLDRLPAAFEGAAIANEVLDAMPLTRFSVDRDGVSVLGVAAGADAGADAGGFRWCTCERTATTAAIEMLVDRHRLPDGYLSEYNPRAAAWVRGIADWLERGVVFIVDYGYPAAEYYHPQRVGGTLRCFFRHVAHADPLRFPGIQDITAHVDFSALAAAATSAGLDIMGFCGLAAFLVGSGLMNDIAAPKANPGAQLAMANEVKRLTLPDEMGETFKVLAIGRGMGRAPGAFARGDRSHIL